MKSIGPQHGAAQVVSIDRDSAPVRAMAEFADVVRMFRALRNDLDGITEVTSWPHYGRMMSVLRRAAIELHANPKAASADALLTEASHQLDVPVVDLLALARVPAHLVANGSWRPRSVNVDLVEPDDSSRGPDSAFQESLNKLSDRLLPKVKELRPPGLYPLYAAASVAVPAIDLAGRAVAAPIAEAAAVVGGWSTELADEVQVKLREIRRATSPSGLTMKDLKALHPLEQKMALMTGQALSGLALEADLFVQWARDPESVARPAGIAAKLKRWSSTGLHGLANFLRAAASTVRVWTDSDSWRTAAVHLQVGGGVEKWWVSSRAGATLMFPTLEQVQREGEAVVKVVSRLNPVDTIVGGMTLTSRGGGLSFRAGPVGAKISDFEHEVKAGIPGIIGLAVGEDYAYGPVIAFGYSPPIGLLNVVELPLNVRIGGELKIFHPAFAALSKPTRTMAEGISIACDALHHTFVRKVEIEEGWPVRQRWALARRLHARAEATKAVASERLAALRAIEPARLMEHVGEENARTLGRDADTPAATHETIASYLEFAVRKIEVESRLLDGMARAEGRGEPIDRKKLTELTRSLKRSVVAFEYVDNLLHRLLACGGAAEEKAA